MKKDFSIDLVFNAFNEIETIEKDLNHIKNLSKKNNLIKKVIVVEDGSSDGTSEKLKELELEMGILLNQSDERRGYSQALIEGIKTSNADFVFFSDLGGKFNWEDINFLINELPENDFILGIRKNRKDQVYRRMLTFFYSFYIWIFYGIKSKDPDSGFRIYKKNIINEILNEEIHNKHLLNSEFTIKCIKFGAKYKEVNVDYINREGKSRGLPLIIIPKVIISTILNSFKIRRQVKNYE